MVVHRLIDDEIMGAAPYWTLSIVIRKMDIFYCYQENGRFLLLYGRCDNGGCEYYGLLRSTPLNFI